MHKIWGKHYLDTLNAGRLEFSDDHATASFIHPGLCYTNFDTEGNPKIRDVLLFFNEIRNTSMLTHFGPDNTNHLDFLELIKDRLIFVRSSEMKFTRELYDKKVPEWPLKVTNSLGHIGNSSMTVNVKVSGESDILLAFQSSTYVLVDRETRKSKPLPDWYKSKYGEKSLHTGPCLVEPFSKPRDTFHIQTLVLWSDTDQNKHTNYSTYVHLAVNCLRAALRKWKQQEQEKSQSVTIVTHNGDDGIKDGSVTPQPTATTVNNDSALNSSNPISGLRGISPEIVSRGLKNVRICYSQESKEGDLLDVHIWQEEGHDDLEVKAVLERGGDALCHIQLEYFGAVMASASSHL